MLVTKTGKPKWNPSTLTEIKEQDINWYFEPFKSSDLKEELSLLTKENYFKYHHNNGVPTELEVEELFKKRDFMDKDDVFEGLQRERSLKKLGGPKIGVKEKLNDILERKCVQEGGKLIWRENSSKL